MGSTTSAVGGNAVAGSSGALGGQAAAPAATGVVGSSAGDPTGRGAADSLGGGGRGAGLGPSGGSAPASGLADLPTPQATGSGGGTASTGDSSPGGTSDRSPGSSRRSSDDIGLSLPEVDLKPLQGADEAVAIVEAERPVISRLEGAWEQIDAGSANDPDFAPGGYVRSVLVIDAASGEMSVYRGFGPPGAEPYMTVSGQLHVEFGREGTVVVGESRTKPTTFPTAERSIQADGASFTIRPPARAGGAFDWTTEPSSGTLVVAGKRHRRLPDDVRDRVVRGGKPLSGEALDAQIARTMPSVPQRGAGPQGGGPSPSGNVDFFGMQVRGRYIAFVVDCSGSMQQANKFATALDELRRTIRALPADVNVYVVFFSETAFEIPGFGKWVAAQTPRCGKLLDAIGGVGAGSGTNPAQALERAFAQAPRPDEIFLMTDGIMPDTTRSLITNLQGGSKARTRVHALAFGADANQGELQAIAADNGGDFRALP